MSKSKLIGPRFNLGPLTSPWLRQHQLYLVYNHLEQRSLEGKEHAKNVDG